MDEGRDEQGGWERWPQMASDDSEAGNVSANVWSVVGELAPPPSTLPPVCLSFILLIPCIICLPPSQPPLCSSFPFAHVVSLDRW